MLPGKYRIVAIVTFIVALLPCRAELNPLEQANEQARQLVQKTMAERRIPALQIAVVKGGKLVLSESYGFANVENQVPATKATLFPINSATKSFTGVAMMQLVEDGRVELDAPVSRYLDDLPEAWRNVRVRQLLAHTSGLPEIANNKGLIGGGTEKEAWQAVRALPVEAPAGERFAYNQTNYGLLAQIIVRQTGLPYEDYLARRQFAPSGMLRASFGDSYDLLPNAVTMYSYIPRGTLAKDDANRLSRWAYDIPYSLWAGGGMQTTAEEVAHWLMALSAGRLISKEHVRAMWQPETLSDGSDGPWAAGWPVLRTGPSRLVAGMGGARAAFLVYPDDELAIVVLTNLVGANPQGFIPQIAEVYKAVPR